VPHGEHVSRDVNDTDVSVTSSADHGVNDVAESTHQSGQSMDVVWKGMVVLAGIYVFFVTERLIAFCRTPRRPAADKVLLI